MTDANTNHSPINPEWLAEFGGARARPFELHMKNAFIHTYKPVDDDEPYRLFETTAEYRQRATTTCRDGWLWNRLVTTRLRTSATPSIGTMRRS